MSTATQPRTASSITLGVPSVLVVDDEPSICWGFERLLSEEGLNVLTASTAEDGLEIARENQLSLVVLDVRLPGIDGISALPDFLHVTHNAPIVVMTAFGDFDTAVGAVRNGATDYLVKPFRLEDALHACRKAMLSIPGSQPPDENRNIEPSQPATLIGRSPAMQHAFRQIALVAESDLSVLITGETGTGKEVAAAAIHQHSRRSEEAYVPVAPVAFHPELIESELFGHAKGAFTGASEDRPGLFEKACGGTILLDEIGDLPMSMQAKLLRVLENGQYTRVGETQPRTTDVRVLAATNCDLHQTVAEGRFRRDLYYRLNGLHIHLPPLRERLEDIPVLCEHFLRNFRHPNATFAINGELLDALCARNWFGNVRELKNALEHAVVIARRRPLVISDFPSEQKSGGTAPTIDANSIHQCVETWAQAALQGEGDVHGQLHEKFLRAFEPTLLAIVLQHVDDNKAKAAELLGIHRGTLRERLRSYGLDKHRPE